MDLGFNDYSSKSYNRGKDVSLSNSWLRIAFASLVLSFCHLLFKANLLNLTESLANKSMTAFIGITTVILTSLIFDMGWKLNLNKNINIYSNKIVLNLSQHIKD